MRAKLRQALNELMELVVLHGRPLGAALQGVFVAAADLAGLREIAQLELFT